MRANSVLFAIAISAVAAAVPSLGQAHVTLEAQQAPAGSTYKAVIRVPHGCAGSPTTAVRVKIPEGVTAVKPQPKPGWQLATVKGKLAQPIVDGHGNAVAEGVVEVAWTGGNLLDEHYDEFVLRVGLPNTPDVTLYFPIVQECQTGVERWIDIPEAGANGHDLPSPAPQLRLTPSRGH
jgi:uncharacterized protein YcnI